MCVCVAPSESTRKGKGRSTCKGKGREDGPGTFNVRKGTCQCNVRQDAPGTFKAVLAQSFFQGRVSSRNDEEEV